MNEVEFQAYKQKLGRLSHGQRERLLATLSKLENEKSRGKTNSADFLTNEEWAALQSIMFDPS